MINEPIGVTNPAHGVMATSPATAPEQAPRTVAFPLCSASIRLQLTVAAAAAVLVFTNAATAEVPADSALPALKPNQPNQSRPVPRAVIVRLCGCMSSVSSARRLPITSTQQRAATPEMMCTTRPPAKSRAPMLWIQPPAPQTQWATGSYTSVDQSSVNST